jgi:hypothetical protein
VKRWFPFLAVAAAGGIATFALSSCKPAAIAVAYPCGPPQTPPARAARFTPSPQQLAMIREAMHRRVRQLEFYVSPARKPYEFLMWTSLQGAGQDGVPVPPVKSKTLKFTFLDEQLRDWSRNVHLSVTLPDPLMTPNPCNPIPMYSTGFEVDPRGLPPGMYTITAQADVGSFRLPDGDEVLGTHANLRNIALYVPPAPRALPSLRAGQRFLLLPDADTEYRDEAGADVSRGDVTMHTATLVRTEGNRLTFAVDGYSRKLVAPAPRDVAHISGIVPLVDDRNVDNLNRRYDGKNVWGRGGFGASCVLNAPGGTWGASGPSAHPIVVRRVFRIYRNVDMAIGPQIGAMGGGRKSEYYDESPLVVWLSVPDDTVFSSVSGTGSIRVQTVSAHAPASAAPLRVNPMGPNDACVAYYTYFADAWDMDRAYSLVPPPAGLREMRNGLTHEQVAWVLGYPSMYGSPAQLDALRAWRYDNLPPFDYWVYFDANDRVVKFGPDGQLP